MSHDSGTRPPAAPGLRHQAGARTVFRVVGLVLLFGGLTAVGIGFIGFASGVFSDTFPPAAEMGRNFALFGVGGLAAVIGLSLTHAGFAGVAARYGAGEAMPVVKDSAAYLTDGQGLLGVGRTVDDLPAEQTATGPYCSSCGIRNDSAARFCDSCGTTIA